MTTKPTTIEEHNAKVEATLAAFAAVNAKINAIPYKEQLDPTPELAVILQDLGKQSRATWNKHKNAKARRTAFLRNAMTTKPTALKYTEAELATAFRKSMEKVFNDMDANSKVAEAARSARIATACRR